MGLKPRSYWTWNIPPSGLTPTEEEALVRALDRFYPIALRGDFHTGGGAEGMCIDASMEFIETLDSVDLHGILVGFNFVHPLDKEDYPVNLNPDHHCLEHWVVRVEGLVIDWTARQFNPAAPFPRIWPIEIRKHRSQGVKWCRRSLYESQLCVFWRQDLDGRGYRQSELRHSIDSEDGVIPAEGWCLVQGSKDPAAWNQKTRCGRSVILPGLYDHRKPTCGACIAILERGMVPEQRDLPMRKTRVN